MFVAMIALIILASHAYHELISGLTRPKFDPIFSMVAIRAFFCALIVGSLFMKEDWRQFHLREQPACWLRLAHWTY